MCGIYFNYHAGYTIKYRHEANRPRGPDIEQIVESDNYLAAFYRLAIVGIAHGMQPFEFDDLIFMCNGEIYNHLELSAKYELPESSGSDCECIGHLYRKLGIEKTVSLLKGEWAFVLYDKKEQIIHFARDRLGRKPLFMSISYSDDMLDAKPITLEVSSLYAGLTNHGIQVIPGYLYSYDVTNRNISHQQYHQFIYSPDLTIGDSDIYDAFVSAIKKRVVQTERPLGYLLSGGFDSSVVLSIALDQKLMTKPPHVFTFGFDEKASDILAAELMVDWLRKKHGQECIQWHKVILPVSEGIDALPLVVRALETYDTTTIRASTPMYLICKYIAENTDVKVVISGEGSDELFGGYLYFKYAPNDVAFRSEIIKLLNNLYLYDVLRADRSSASHGLEIRPPFLDDDFVDVVLKSKDLVRDLEFKERTIPSKSNTKALIRRIVSEKNLLPEEILYGKKEAFSDAVGFSWKDTITNFAIDQMELLDVENSLVYSPHLLPDTAESKYFQTLFKYNFGAIKKVEDLKGYREDGLYGDGFMEIKTLDVSNNEAMADVTPWWLLYNLWLPNQSWVKTGSEPSARALMVYSNESVMEPVSQSEAESVL